MVALLRPAPADEPPSGASAARLDRSAQTAPAGASTSFAPRGGEPTQPPSGPAAPQAAAARFTQPAGAAVTLFASEPEVVQPIAFTFDDQGRLWVVENRSYPGWKAEGRDRVLILSDRDGDGRCDDVSVFTDTASNLSGIEIGFGGVWLCSSPNLVFIPDADADGRPDGPPRVMLDGWDTKAQHNVFNSLRFGPDGWLYGCNGILSNSLPGAPGTPQDQRSPLNCGVWRYHPTAQTFEVVAHGTTNPWGLDFDDYGQMFITNCVIDHAWHVLPGAHYQRMFGQDFNPHLFELMPSCVDHIHWAGGPWQEARGGAKHDSFGGGHAHSGAAIVLSDAWPQAQRQSLLLCNIHGNRVNEDRLERTNHGYVAHHADDFCHAHDPWFRGVALQAGPDGAMYIADWSDTGECHNYEVVDRSNGRIFRVAPSTADVGVPAWGLQAALAGRHSLAELSDRELAEMQAHRTDWLVRHARRLLQERAARGPIDAAAIGQLHEFLAPGQSVTLRLRALWALAAAEALGADRLAALMDDPEAEVRAWAVRLAVDRRAAPNSVVQRMLRRAGKETSFWVRLELASALQRLPSESALALSQTLLLQDAPTPRSLALLTWYGIEPMAGRLLAGDTADRNALLALVRSCRIPLVREFLVRRMAASTEQPIETWATEALSGWLAECDDPAAQADIALGLTDALQGRRGAKMPSRWQQAALRLSAHPRAETRQQGQILALVFGDQSAAVQLLQTARDVQAGPDTRRLAVTTLAEARSPELSAALADLLDDEAVRLVALQAMSAFETAATPGELLTRYERFDDETRRAAIAVLASRVAYAGPLLDAVERGSIPRRDVTAFHLQQLASLGNGHVSARVEQLLGTIRSTPADRAAAIADHLRRFPPGRLAQANLPRGRMLFAQTCGTCHKLFDAGGAIGPELTGSQRASLEYVLKNVLDPSAVVARDYQMTIFELSDGRVLSGIVKRETEHAVAVQTATELFNVAKSEIESRRASGISMMPEGLLAALAEEELRDLFAYLASDAQVPLPGAARASGGQ